MPLMASVIARGELTPGVTRNLTKGETYQAEPFPEFIKDMIQKGGLMASIQARKG